MVERLRQNKDLLQEAALCLKCGFVCACSHVETAGALEVYPVVEEGGRVSADIKLIVYTQQPVGGRSSHCHDDIRYDGFFPGGCE